MDNVSDYKFVFDSEIHPILIPVYEKIQLYFRDNKRDVIILIQNAIDNEHSAVVRIVTNDLQDIFAAGILLNDYAGGLIGFNLKKQSSNG